MRRAAQQNEDVPDGVGVLQAFVEEKVRACCVEQPAQNQPEQAPGCDLGEQDGEGDHDEPAHRHVEQRGDPFETPGGEGLEHYA